MNLSIIGMVEHRRVHGTRYPREVADRSEVTYASATVITARAASEAPPVMGPIASSRNPTWGRGYQAFAFVSARLPNRPKSRTAAAGKECA